MMKLIVFVIAAIVCWQVGAAVEWKNLDKEHHLGGRVTSEGYMRGKVTLVCRWGLKFQKCRTMLPKLGTNGDRPQWWGWFHGRAVSFKLSERQ